MTFHFVTYGSGDFAPRARSLAQSAKQVGFDRTHVLSSTDIAGSPFARRNAAILEASRGDGYWLWKPYVIRRLLARMTGDDILLYSDAGRSDYYRFSRFPARLVAWVRRNPQGFLAGTAIGHLGNIGAWTKRDCLVAMDADRPDIHDRPVVQASWSLWTRSAPAMAFLDAWLARCQDPRCLTDQGNVLGRDNLDGFVDHRHDQSICTILACQTRAPVLDFSQTRVHRILRMRPGSTLGGMFYKRVQNCDDLLARDTPRLLLREYLRLRRVA